MRKRVYIVFVLTCERNGAGRRQSVFVGSAQCVGAGAVHRSRVWGTRRARVRVLQSLCGARSALPHRAVHGYSAPPLRRRLVLSSGQFCVLARRRRRRSRLLIVVALFLLLSTLTTQQTVKCPCCQNPWELSDADKRAVEVCCQFFSI